MDDIQRLILQVEGEEKLKSLNAELIKEKDFLKDLLEIQRQGVVGINPADIESSARRMVQLNQQINELSKSSKGLAGTQGLLQLQYVMDDLVNTSGNWERHLASISNNIPGLVTSLGGSMGLAGAIGLIATAAIALAPAVKAAWDNLAGNEPELAKERLKELKKEAEDLTKAFDKLSNVPDSGEKLAGESRQIYLEMPGHAATAQRLAAQGFGQKEVDAAMTDEEKLRLKPTEGLRTMTDEDITAKAQQGREQALRAQAAGTFAGQPMEWYQRDKAEWERRRSVAQNEYKDISRTVRGRMAKELVVGAAKPGRAAEQQGIRLRQLLPEDMRQNLPTALEAETSDKQTDAWLETTQGWADQGKEKRAKAAKAKAAQAKRDRETDMLNRQGQAADEARRKAQEDEAAKGAKDLDRRMAEGARHGEEDRYAATMSDFNRRNGSGLSDHQIQEAARQVVGMTRSGADAVDAMTVAFDLQLSQMRALQQRLQQQAARIRGLGTGPDQSGNFCQLTPSLGF